MLSLLTNQTINFVEHIKEEFIEVYGQRSLI